jgi:hypothetical protein
LKYYFFPGLLSSFFCVGKIRVPQLFKKNLLDFRIKLRKIKRYRNMKKKIKRSFRNKICSLVCC